MRIDEHKEITMLKNNDAGLSDIAARLHEQRRRVIADLVVTDPGW